MAFLLIVIAILASTANAEIASLQGWLKANGGARFQKKLEEFGASSPLDLRYLEMGDLQELGMSAKKASDFLVAVRDRLPWLPKERKKIKETEGETREMKSKDTEEEGEGNGWLRGALGVGESSRT